MSAIDTNPLNLPNDDLDSILNALDADWAAFKNKRVFITGGTGFIGKWLLGSLLYANERRSLNCHISVVSRNPTAFVDEFPKLKQCTTLEFIAGDLSNFPLPEQSYDYIIHAATDVINPGSELDVFDTCINGTWRVLEFARTCKASSFLFISSGAVYGSQDATMFSIDESVVSAPATYDIKAGYGEGKRGAEWLCTAYAKQHQLSTKIARCFAFVGPHLALDGHFAIGNFVRDALQGKDIIIQGDGTPYRSYLYASDMVVWLWRILLSGKTCQPYNVGGSQPFSIVELATEVVKTLKSNVQIKVLKPADPAFAASRYIPNTRLAQNTLNLSETINLPAGIQKYAAWCTRNIQ